LKKADKERLSAFVMNCLRMVLRFHGLPMTNE